jgi:hypothetical protein
MTTTLKYILLLDARVMRGYCELFGAILSSLADNRSPTPASLRQSISQSAECDAQIYLQQEDGDVRYALEYLIDTLRDAMSTKNQQKHLAEGLSLLPLCFNDHNYWLLKENLLKKEGD